VRLYFASFLLVFCAFWARSAPDTNVAPRALPVDPSELTNAAPVVPPMPLAVPGGINIHWYGHGFVLITSSVGVRAAIDPYGPNTVHYTFPAHVVADFVLVSHEAEDHGATENIFGNPLIFRSVTAVGLNRANGTEFHGVALQRDPSGQGGANTAFNLTFDGIRMGYLGQISAPLIEEEKAEMGAVDVLFLPVGLATLTVAQLNQVATDLGARVIIPINYKTNKSGDLPLRGLDEYLAGTKLPVRRFDTDEIVLTHDSLPPQPTIYLLKSP
jgi:L-ascorbate metabolism protein UlaG (beta-lactamase superfamily)